MTFRAATTEWGRPQWTESDGVHSFDLYVIEQATDGQGGWQISLDVHWPSVDSALDSFRYNRLSGAKAWVALHRRWLARRTKLLRHGLIACVSALVVIASYGIMRSSHSAVAVAAFTVGAVSILICVAESVGFAHNLVGDTDYYQVKPRNGLDRIVCDLVGTFRRPLAEAPETGTNVRIVPWNPNDPRG